MTKFCANCGAPMDEEDRVCGQCGTPVAGAPAPSAGTKKGGTVGKAAGNNSLIIKLAIGIAALVVVIIVAVNLVGSMTGYKSTLNKMTKALKDYDVDTIESLSSSITDEMLSWYGDDLYDYYDEWMSDVLDEFEENVGEIKKISYEITDATEMTERRLENLKDELTEYYNMDTRDIKEIVEVDLQLIVKGEDKSAAYNVRDLRLVKEDGGWKINFHTVDF